MALARPLLVYPVTICGLEELAAHGTSGFSHVISILDPAWPDPGEFADYRPHQRFVWRFDDVVRAKSGAMAPGERDVEGILALGRRLEMTTVTRLLIHCHAGVSRSTAVAIILMARENPGREREIFAELVRIRPKSWPNALMVGHADALLGRGGALLAALKAHQRDVIRAFPQFAEMLLRSDRAHEVTAVVGEPSPQPTITELATELAVPAGARPAPNRR
jgi:predicted protein tyrosine phosphatase